MNILFIGNSYTYYNDMPVLFDTLCKANGRDVKVFAVTCPDRKLYENLTPYDSHWAKVREITAENHIDVCILQENSLLPITDNDAFINGLTMIKDDIGARVSKFVLYETWGRKNGAEFLAENRLSSVAMTNIIHEKYKKAAELMEMEISPVGKHFADVYRGGSGIELYCSDNSHPAREGSCLAACVHYKTIFGKLPQNMACLKLTSYDIFIFTASLEKDFE